MKVNFTFCSQQTFKEMNIGLKTDNHLSYVPKYRVYLEFGRIYYTIQNGNLTAFKPILYSFRNGEYYCVSPIKKYWVKITEQSIIFNSKEHYLEYVSGKAPSLNLHIVSNELENVKYNGLHLFENSSSNDFNSSLNKTCKFNHVLYRWCNTSNKPVLSYPSVNVMFLNENGLYINIDLGTNEFKTYEECVKHHLNGMKIIEFGEEIKIDIDIKVSAIPKIHTLKFVED